MSSFNQIQTACGALGYFDGKTYLKDDDCEGWKKNDLIKNIYFVYFSI
jgi:hypothetical protein